MKRIIAALGFMVFTGIIAFAIEIPSGIISAFQKGDASALSVYFSSTLELTLHDKEEIYSRSQAEVILHKFFSDNPPSQFKIIHQGGKEQSKYAIGTMTSGSKSFRVTFLLKTEENKVLIHQLRIENEYVE
jgi:hypothetical protein